MPVEFSRWEPPLPLHKKAYGYLQEACKRSQLSVLTAEQTIQQAQQRLASIYVVTDNHEIIGCFVLSLRLTPQDKYLELPLLAGKYLKNWRTMLVDFLFEYANYNDCTKFTMIGRKGFERLFPELKLLCCVYGRNLTEAS